MSVSSLAHQCQQWGPFTPACLPHHLTSHYLLTLTHGACRRGSLLLPLPLPAAPSPRLSGIYNISLYGAGVFRALSPHYIYYFFSVSMHACVVLSRACGGGCGWW